MKRKAFLFTVMSLLLLGSLFSLTGYYLTRSKSTQEIKTSVIADKLGYINSDIARSYFDILGIEFNTIQSFPGIKTVKFNRMYTLPDTENYNAKLSSYETFLEGTYSSLTNTEVVIRDLTFTPQFKILPFQTSFVPGNELYVYTENSAAINNLFIQIILSQSGAFTSGAPAGDLTGPTVRVVVKLANGAIALNEIRQLAVNEENPSFYVDVEGQRLDIFFGLINSRAGTLRVAPLLLSATVERLDIGYNSAEKIYLTAGIISINPKIYDTTKQGVILLAEG